MALRHPVLGGSIAHMGACANGSLDSRSSRSGGFSKRSYDVLPHRGHGLCFVEMAVGMGHCSRGGSLWLVDRFFGLSLVVGPFHGADPCRANNVGDVLEGGRCRTRTISIFDGKGFPVEVKSAGSAKHALPLGKNHIRCGHWIPIKLRPWARTLDVSSHSARREARSLPSDLRTGQAS